MTPSKAGMANNNSRLVDVEEEILRLRERLQQLGDERASISQYNASNELVLSPPRTGRHVFLGVAIFHPQKRLRRNSGSTYCWREASRGFFSPDVQPISSKTFTTAVRICTGLGHSPMHGPMSTLYCDLCLASPLSAASMHSAGAVLHASCPAL